MSVEPTRIASAPASSASAAWARFPIALSATIKRSRGAFATSSSCVSPVDRERAEVARVHADDLGAEGNGTPELHGVVCLDEEVEPELAPAGEEERGLLVVQVSQEQQGRVRACAAGLEQVAPVVEEALGEERDIGRGPGGREIVEGAAEALVDEDGNRRPPARRRPSRAQRGRRRAAGPPPRASAA